MIFEKAEYPGSSGQDFFALGFLRNQARKPAGCFSKTVELAFGHEGGEIAKQFLASSSFG